MRNKIITSMAAVLLASPAIAGSLSPVFVEKTPAPAAMPMMMSNWTGGYIGANLNYGSGSLDATGDLGALISAAGLSTTLSEPDGTAGAIRAGYDWHTGRSVFGLGAEYNFGKYEGGLTGDYDAVAVAAGIDDLTIRVDEMATVFARAGYAVSDQFLAYGLLGYSWANGTVSAAGESENADLKGVTIGLGGEFKLNQNWSTYGEYAYTNFGDIDNTDGTLEADLHQVKIGVNYRF
jgi:outer membrane immunogenic protein